MGAMTDALTAVQAVLTTAGIATVYREFSTATPESAAAHCVLSVEAASLDRGDADTLDGSLTVTVDWFSPGNESDGETEFLAAMDAWDAIVVALCGLDRTCQSVDPGGSIVRLEESADLAHWYAATATVTFMRKESGI